MFCYNSGWPSLSRIHDENIRYDRRFSFDLPCRFPGRVLHEGGGRGEGKGKKGGLKVGGKLVRLGL